MRSNPKHCSILFLFVSVAVCFVLIQLVNFLHSPSYLKNVELHHDDDDALAVEKSQLCAPCPTPPALFEEVEPQIDNSLTDDDVILVPISDIMSGKPFVLPQEDKHIIEYIWSNGHIKPPTFEKYNLAKPNQDPSMERGQFISKLLNNMTNGFFVECGALDGETRSNTLFLEKNLNWFGLLVERDPTNFALLQSKNRQAWISNVCMSINSYPYMATFNQSLHRGKILDTDTDSQQEKMNTGAGTSNQLNVQCMPLFSLLAAINVSIVDYFSLNVEGGELEILKTIPFEKVYIRTLSVEFSHTTAEGKAELEKFMKANGYRLVGEVSHKKGWANDFMFVHKNATIDSALLGDSKEKK